MSEKDKYTKDTDKRFTLRMDKELFDIVKKSAEKNRRSVAKEIEFILLKQCEEMGLYTPTQDDFDERKPKESKQSNL